MTTVLPNMSQVFQARPRFQRSVNIERDFNNEKSLAGYVLTDSAYNSLVRISDGLLAESGCKAWRITGDYGVGKSSFALLLASVVSGQAGALPLKGALRFEECVRQWTGCPLLPVLVTGSRESLSRAILRGMRNAIERIYTRKPRSKEYNSICEALKDKSPTSGRDTVGLVEAMTNRLVSDGRVSGMLLVIDEMGKFLEHDLLASEAQDVYLLQEIAESATRSGTRTIAVVGIMHMGMRAYTQQLGPTEMQEWLKIGGRFEEVAFSQPLRDVADILASALGVSGDELPTSCRTDSQECMSAAVDMGLFGPAPTDHLKDIAPHLFPLSPILLPFLVRLLHRFGQNERSVLSFAISHEPFGLQDYAAQRRLNDGLYGANHLYDYVRANLTHHLLVDNPPNRWALIDSLVQHHGNGNSLETQVLKTVGLLNLVDATDFLATDKFVSWLVAGPNARARARVVAVLEKLSGHERKLHYRGLGGGYCLWPHTSVDLDALLKDTHQKLGRISAVSRELPSYLNNRPIVARRHYIETGNLRHFDVRYCRADTIAQHINSDRVEADGLVLVPLPDTAQDVTTAIEAATKSGTGDERVVVAVVPPLRRLASKLQETRCWEWIVKNAAVLNSDSFAREEAARQRNASRQELTRAVGDLVNLREGRGTTSVRWFWRGEEIKIQDSRGLLSLLSTICDHVYFDAPRIQNELVNRRRPSSVAAAARTRLIGRILGHSGEAFLGMEEEKKPPEMSIYLSVLKHGGLHVHQDDEWRITPPSKDDPCNLRPAFVCIDRMLLAESDARVRVDHILGALCAPPYGIRAGFAPLLIALYYTANRDTIALYEEGTFSPEVDHRDFQRLQKEPGSFELQYCNVGGVRSSVFMALATALELPKATTAVGDRVLGIVTPLCTFVARLPKHTIHTRRLSSRAQAVRDTILAARDPVKLLFADLPEACGHHPIQAQKELRPSELPQFAATLRSAVEELRLSSVQLRSRISGCLDENFAVTGALASKRAILRDRAERILPHIMEPRLRSFCMRIEDDGLPDDRWLEAISTYIVKKPPSLWSDDDEAVFNQELYFLCTSFKRMERFDFAQVSPGNRAIRVSLTSGSGEELEEIVYPEKADLQEVETLVVDIRKTVQKRPDLAIAALSSVLSEHLTTSSKKTSTKQKRDG